MVQFLGLLFVQLFFELGQRLFELRLERKKGRAPEGARLVLCVTQES